MNGIQSAFWSGQLKRVRTLADFLSSPPASLVDPEMRRQSRLIQGILIWSIICGGAILVSQPIWVPESLNHIEFWLIAALWPLALLALAQARRGYTHRAAAASIAALFLMFSTSPFSLDHLQSLSLYFVLPIILTSIFFSPGWTIAIMALTLLVPFGMSAIQTPLQIHDHEWMLQSIVFTLPIGIMILLYNHHQRLAEREQREAALLAKVQRAAQARYNALFEQSHDAVFILNFEGQHIEANRRAAEMLGYSIEEIQKLSVRDTSAEVEESQGLIERLMAGEHIPPYERKFRHRDGSIFPVEINVELVRDEDGKPLHIQSVVRDISERKQVEKQLRLQSAALEYAANAVLITDRNGLIEWANPAFTQLTGYTIEEARGKQPGKLLQSGKQDNQYYQSMWETISAGKTWQSQITNRRKDGSLFIEEQFITPVLDEKGEITHFVAIIQDISERQKADNALRESEKRLQNILDSMQEAVWSVQLPDFKPLYINAAAERIFGRPKQVFYEDRNTWTHLIYPETTRPFQEMLSDVMKKGRISREMRLRRPDGEDRWVNGQIWLVHNGNGEPVALEGITSDITSRKQIEMFQQQFLDDMRALQKIHLDLSRIDNLDTLYQQMVIMPRERLGLERVGLFILNETGKHLSGTYGVDTSGLLRDEHYYQETITTDHWSLQVLNTPNHVRFWPDSDIVDNGKVVGTGWKAGAALWNGQRSFGYLATDNFVSGRPARPYETELISVLGSIFGHLIERKRSEETQHRFLDDMRALQSIHIKLSRIEQIDTLYRQMILLTREKLGLERVGLFILNEAGDKLSGTYGIDPSGNLRSEHYYHETVTQDHWSLEMLNAADHVHFWSNSLLNDNGESVGSGWRAGAALWNGQRPLGYLVTDNLISGRQARPYETELISVLGTIFGHLLDRKRSEEALRQSETRFKMILQGTRAGTWEWDIRTGQTIFNDRWAETVGYTLEDLSPTTIQTWTQLLDPEDLQVSNDKMQNHLEGKTPFYECEVRMKHKDGHWVWVWDRGKVMEWDSEGQPSRMFGTLIDITERKQVEEALRQSEERQRAMLKAIPDIILRHREDGTFLDYHAPEPDPLHIAHRHFVGKTLQEIFPSSIAHQALDISRQVIETGQMARYEFDIHVKGETRRFEVRTVPVSQSEMLSIARDMTELWHAQKELETAKARLEFTVEAAHIAWWEMNLHTGKLWSDPRRITMIGYQPQDFQSMTYHNLINMVHPDDREGLAAAMTELVSGVNSIYSVDYRMPTADGHWMWFHDRGEIEENSEGESVVRGFVMDITERKLSEQHAFELALEKERVSLLRDFIEKASHEFRTPLAIINTSTYIMARANDTERRVQKASLISGQVQHITKLLDMLLTLVRLESGAATVFVPVDMDTIVDRACDKHIIDSGPTLTRKRLFSLPLVMGSSADLEEAISQIVHNAVRFTPPEGRITITNGVDKNSLWITVRDTGSGISEEALPHIFETFWREDQAHTTPGFGLGLAIARKILEMHGGSIEVESAVGIGSTFRIILPVFDPTMADNLKS